MNVEAEELVRSARGRYGSLEEPDFSFVMEALRVRPYEGIEQELRQQFDVEEIADPNDDVSFAFVVGRGPRRWSLQLSMVERLALLMRIEPEGNCRVIETNDAIDPAEQGLLALLQRHGVRVATADLLATPVRLMLSNTEPEDTCLYQALFTDSSVLPWNMDEPGGSCKAGPGTRPGSSTRG
jgi:hypothetical protein